MADENGIGLAAPQVGRNIRLVVVDTRPSEEVAGALFSEGEQLLNPLMPVALLNPVVEPVGDQSSRFTEGCLSIPGIDGEVVRPTRVRLRAKLEDDTDIDVECDGLLARCLQHEIDHLDGVLFVDRMSALDRVRIGPKLLSLKSLGRSPRS